MFAKDLKYSIIEEWPFYNAADKMTCKSYDLLLQCFWKQKYDFEVSLPRSWSIFCLMTYKFDLKKKCGSFLMLEWSHLINKLNLSIINILF